MLMFSLGVKTYFSSRNQIYAFIYSHRSAKLAHFWELFFLNMRSKYLMSLTMSRGMAAYSLSIGTNLQILRFQTLFSSNSKFNVNKVLPSSVITYSALCLSCWGQHGLKWCWLFPLGMISDFLVPVVLLTVQTICRSDKQSVRSGHWGPGSTGCLVLANI